MKKLLLNGLVEVRADDAGEFDELVTTTNRCHVHFEMLDDNTLWVAVTPEGSEGEVHLVISAGRCKLMVTAEEA